MSLRSGFVKIVFLLSHWIDVGESICRCEILLQRFVQSRFLSPIPTLTLRASHKLEIFRIMNKCAVIITKTRLYNFDPLKPHLYVVKMGFTYIIFIIFARRGSSNEYPQSMFLSKQNGRFPLTSMLTSLKNYPKCLTQNLILSLSSLQRENPMRIKMYIT